MFSQMENSRRNLLYDMAEKKVHLETITKIRTIH